MIPLYALPFIVNGESFAGLNFHGIHIIWIFPVILSQCKARALICGTKNKRFMGKLSCSVKTAKI